ncbi:S-adenosylmethionine:tRNA ribosyltransferase-isomerase [Agaricicola taiwanensis]|uniref:S-adenosylmethionine:tRNA ribosyltransferase-isomerase n=1 Tax=Agaricicola taiwanensis TaxID=591372 RepID=A0A8J3DTW8_9RHOB|nr:tRNA preQ1(34) S-adenosylmethionine ribosyltransferase-isomerase QueA [Agaricicola taiwanensis]GGE44908.1 S-adenosylmethionine:tRNA ribosyltransferase-isomerase [Agaricicola taiwanensis]
MDVSLFDFDLPEERIALRPANPRDSARLLVVEPDRLQDRIVSELPDILRPGDLLVANNTRVIPARLIGRRTGRGETEPKIEAMLHMRVDSATWKAFAKPARKLEVGDRLQFGGGSNACLLGHLEATVADKGEAGEITLAFDLAGPDLDFAIAAQGTMPLPPYIAGKRPPDERDQSDYQTLFAREEGAVAAPTAGLHFTPSLHEKLEVSGVSICNITLHVGAGTFLPVKVEDTKNHRMHAERGYISAEAAEQINAVRQGGGRVIAIGTTALRLLESAAAEDGTLSAWSDATDIFITPGYRFRSIDALLTNFHLPRSTLFMLVSAFAGLERMKSAYAHAIAGGYRFYSYGDASLLFPENPR